MLLPLKGTAATGKAKQRGPQNQQRASPGTQATERWAASTRRRGTRRCWLDCLIDAIPMSSFAPVTGVDEIPCWSSINETSEAVRISKARLRSLQAAGKLKPGIHWVYRTGTKGGPVSRNIATSKEWQIRETKRVFESGTIQEIETYGEQTIHTSQGA